MERNEDDSGRCYVYKQVDWPFYRREDTQAILPELRSLRRFRRAPNIVQLVLMVRSTILYLTMNGDTTPAVIRGIMVGHHPGGRLDQTLKEAEEVPWR